MSMPLSDTDASGVTTAAGDIFSPYDKTLQRQRSRSYGNIAVDSLGSSLKSASGRPSLDLTAGLDVELDADGEEMRPLLPKLRQRTGDTISSHQAVLTLCKAMFNAGCFSLPYAWKLGGLWTSLVLQCVISGFNWYGNDILVRTAQYMATVYKKPALDYGHFTKYVLDLSGVPHLQRQSKRYMSVEFMKSIVRYFVNCSILFYQLGLCSVAILFIATNLQNVALQMFDYPLSITACATVAFVIVLLTNMVTELRVISVFAIVSTVFFLLGAAAILYYCATQPTQWQTLPAYTDFTSTITFIGMAMYSFEGQTLILPIENKLRHPEDFVNNCGVLPTTMWLATLLLTAIGFFGYTAFGDLTATTITLNLPRTFTVVNICLMLQSTLGHCMMMYPVFDMFGKGFKRKAPLWFPFTKDYPTLMDRLFRTFFVLLTYLLAILLPKLEILIPLVGVTSGTLCAFIFPPALQLIVFYRIWRRRGELTYFVVRNGTLILLGVALITCGIYANTLAIIDAFM